MNIYKLKTMELNATIETLKTMLPAKDFILTGSYVLAKYGLVTWDTVMDLDIILVQPEVVTIEMLNRFMKEHPAPTTARLRSTVLPVPEAPSLRAQVADIKNATVAPVKKALQAIFIFNHVKIDIYIEDDFRETTLLIDGTQHTIVPHIIAAKKTYGRMKDWMQCREMSRMFYKDEEFQIAINRNWRSMLRSDY
jgi:hypothetical protein